MPLNPTRNREHLPPDYEHLIHALRNFGYSFEESVADIVDNSIDAGATCVDIRFVIRENGSVDLLIADNGRGMDAAALRDAMVFGTQKAAVHQNRLGKFGLGLKMASIAQALNVHVVSHRDGKLTGKVWSDKGLKDGFFCEDLEESENDTIKDLSSVPLDEGHGTWVLWEFLHRHAGNFNKSQMLCDQLIVGLMGHLGMHFHRFINRGSLEITVLVVNHLLEESCRRKVESFDPFGYPESGCEGYPVELHPTELSGYRDKLAIKAHIWPRGSKSRNYASLPGGVMPRQGLYFYRNDRLISAGGWYDLKDGFDSHYSLGRVEIDLKDVDLERELSLDVKKAFVKMTPALRIAIKHSSSSDGVTFTDYLKAVNAASRPGGKEEGEKKKKSKGSKEVSATTGFTDGMKGLIDRLAANPQVDQIGGEVVWKTFEDADIGKFFLIDQDGGAIELNDRFRPLFSTTGSDNVVRIMMFLLVGEYIGKGEMTDEEEESLRKLGLLLAGNASAEDLIAPENDGGDGGRSSSGAYVEVDMNELELVYSWTRLRFSTSRYNSWTVPHSQEHVAVLEVFDYPSSRPSQFRFLKWSNKTDFEKEKLAEVKIEDARLKSLARVVGRIAEDVEGARKLLERSGVIGDACHGSEVCLELSCGSNIGNDSKTLLSWKGDAGLATGGFLAELEQLMLG